jgi:hypothetical protein
MVTQKQFSVGDSVSFTLGTTSILGVVIDDRGPIGANSVHIYRVRIPNDPYDDDVFEMPEDELAFADHTVESIPNSSVVDYLAHGGLVQILKSNTSGGKNQPRVWLTRDSIGNVIHTFTAERGTVGGATVPVSALHDNRVVAAKVNEVLSFLKTFGLSHDDARCVVNVIGTAP